MDWLENVEKEDVFEVIRNSFENYHLPFVRFLEYKKERNTNYGNYISFVHDEEGSPYGTRFVYTTYNLGPFGRIVIDGDNIYNDMLNLLYVRSENVYPYISTFYANWIKMVARKNQGILNEKGQTYFEELKENLAQAIEESKKLELKQVKKKIEDEHKRKIRMQALFLSGFSDLENLAD